LRKLTQRPRNGTTYLKRNIRYVSILTDRKDASKKRWSKPCPPNPDGSPVSEIDARKVAADLQREYDADRWDPWAQREETKAILPESVAQYSVRWLDARDRQGLRTVRTDRGYMTNHILPVIGALGFAEVTAVDARRLVATLDRAAAASKITGKTALNIWACASKMFGDACASKIDELRIRIDNPCVGVKPPDRSIVKAKSYLYPSECTMLLACESEKVQLHWRRIFAVAVYTYARAGEIEALSWTDVDLARGIIHIHCAADRETGHVRETKTGITRRLPIEPELLPLLRAMHAESNGRGRVIPSMPSRELGASTLRAALIEAGVTRAELFITDRTRKNITFHDLRATGITWCAVRGDEPLRIQRRAGHTDFATTQEYIREAESIAHGFEAVFPPLPGSLWSPATRSATGVPGTEHFVAESLLKTVASPTGFEPVSDKPSRATSRHFEPLSEDAGQVEQLDGGFATANATGVARGSAPPHEGT
jgi:integrase